jgi:phosphoribosylanthranilate isomerase
MKIKVCGMRDAENIREVKSLGIDMMGFIFWPKSPRYVQMISSEAGIIPDYSEERLRTVAADRESAVGDPSHPQPSALKAHTPERGGRLCGRDAADHRLPMCTITRSTTCSCTGRRAAR